MLCKMKITKCTLVIIAIMNDYEEIEFSLEPPKLKLRKKTKSA